MPYVITTAQPCANCKQCDRSLTAAGTRGSIDCPHRDVTERSRAVAAPEGAEKYIIDLLIDLSPDNEIYVAPFRATYESGSTVFPLPDGTVITVAETDYDTLASDAGMDPAHAVWDTESDLTPEEEREVIAAYNAAQERGLVMPLATPAEATAFDPHDPIPEGERRRVENQSLAQLLDMVDDLGLDPAQVIIVGELYVNLEL